MRASNGTAGEYIITSTFVDTESTYCYTSVSSFNSMKYTYESAICQSNENIGAIADVGSVTQDLAATRIIDSGRTVEAKGASVKHMVTEEVEIANTIKDFLRKPQIVQTGVWATTDPINTNLETIAIGSTLTSTAIWASKILGFRYIRADCIITVQINASPFQQGKLLLHYLPCESYLQSNTMTIRRQKAINQFLLQKVQHPHAELSCRETSISFRVPYIAPTNYYDLVSGQIDWGTFYLDVFSPLLTGAAASSTYVDYTIMFHWENVELYAPTVPQSDSKVKKRGGAESAENSGPISGGLRKVGSVANALKGIPVISDYAKPVEWAANIAADAASLFGWSKPRNNDGIETFAVNVNKYAGTCDGPDTAIPGGTSCLNKLQPISNASYTNEDEMSYKFLLSVPVYMGEYNWDAVAGSGTIIYYYDVSPYSMLEMATDTVSTHTCVYDAHTPASWLARLHGQWRGNIKMKLKFVKTEMHSGRLLVTFTPGYPVSTSPTLDTSTYALRTIVDVRNESEVTIDLPFINSADYLTANSYSGRVNIFVLNDLRAPESCAQNVKIQVFYDTSDVEFARPNIGGPSIPYIPQSDETAVARDVEKVMDVSGIGGYVTQPDAMIHAERCTGEKLFSIKNLLLRNSAIIGGGAFDLTVTKSFVMNPNFIAAQSMNASGVLVKPLFCGDVYSQLCGMYLFQRGGVRMTIVTENDNVLKSTVIGDWFASNSTYKEPVQDNTTYVQVPNVRYFTNASYSTVNYTRSPMNFYDHPRLLTQHCPFYSAYPFTFNKLMDGVNTPYVDYTQNQNAFVAACPAAFGTCSLERAVCDDFQLMFFICAPCTIRTYT